MAELAHSVHVDNDANDSNDGLNRDDELYAQCRPSEGPAQRTLRAVEDLPKDGGGETTNQQLEDKYPQKLRSGQCWNGCERHETYMIPSQAVFSLVDMFFAREHLTSLALQNVEELVIHRRLGRDACNVVEE